MPSSSSSEVEHDSKRSKSEQVMKQEKKEKKSAEKEKRKRQEQEEELRRMQEEPTLTSVVDLMKSGFGNLQGTIGTMQGQLSGVAGQMAGLTTELLNFKTQTQNNFQTVDQTLKLHAEQIAQLQATPVPPSPEPAPTPGTSSFSTNTFIPKSQRRIIVVRGFPYDSMSTDIIADLKDITKDVTNLVDITAPGKLSSIGKLIFKDAGAMWNFLKRMKGIKLKSVKFPQALLNHSIDQNTDERLLAKKVSYIINNIRTHAVAADLVKEEDTKKTIDGDWDRGYVFVKLEGRPAIRVCDYNKTTNIFTRNPATDGLEWVINFEAIIGEANVLTLGR